MPTPTYVAIAKTVLTGNSTSITLSSIPSTYTDLLLVISARSDQAAWLEVAYGYLNSSTGANYSSTDVIANGNGATFAASSNRDSSQTQFYPEPFPAGNTTSNTFSNIEIYIPNYAGSSNKAMSMTGVSETNSATRGRITARAHLWSQTAAINSIKIDTTAGNFVSGSRFDLYGIKNS